MKKYFVVILGDNWIGFIVRFSITIVYLLLANDGMMYAYVCVSACQCLLSHFLFLVKTEFHVRDFRRRT